MLSSLLCPCHGFILPRVPDCGYTGPKPTSGPEFPTPLNSIHPEALSLPPLIFLATNLFRLQGYLAHKKTPTPLEPPYDPRHKPTVGS